MTRRRAVGGAAALTATALAFALAAIIAGHVGPPVARPGGSPTLPPAPVSGVTAVPQQPIQIPEQVPPGTGGQWLWWMGVGLCALLVLALLWWIAMALRRPPRMVATATPGTASPLIDSALGDLSGPADVDLGDERTFRAALAADDIIASWEVVEKVAAAVGFSRRTASTPTEFMQDVVAGAGDADIDASVLAHIDGASKSDSEFTRYAPSLFIDGVGRSDSEFTRYAPSLFIDGVGRFDSEFTRYAPSLFIDGVGRFDSEFTRYAPSLFIDGEVRAEVLPAGRADASTVLLKLYHRARFDTATLAPGAATVARVAAHNLIESWDLSRRRRIEAAAATGISVAAQPSDSSGAPGTAGGRHR